jgi:hypothetical protein
VTTLDLSLIPTDDLVDALKARFDYLILSALQVTGGARADDHLFVWNGHSIMCVGLAMDMVRSIQDWTLEDIHPGDGEAP